MGSVERLHHPHFGGVEPTDGWMWNGHAWVWVGGPPPCPPAPCPPQFPPCPPAPCPPQFPPCPPPGSCAPPQCTDWLAKIESCWDQSQDLEALLTKIITQIFTDDPSIIPPAPPSAGSGPIIGVTDGSDAAPGEVGEYVTLAVNGVLAANAGLATYQALTLTPGDWDLWSYLDVDIPVGSTQFFQQLYFRLSANNVGVCFGDMGGVWPAGSGFGGGIWPTNTGRVSVSAPVLIVAAVEVWGYAGAEADITINTFARRVR
jgi:hypothetical protein